MMPFGVRPQASEGVSVIGEATRAMHPDTVEVAFEIRSAGPSAAQAVRENAMKLAQVNQAILALGVAQGDVQNTGPAVFAIGPPAFALPGQPNLIQMAQAGMGSYAPVPQPPLVEAAAPVGYAVSTGLKLTLRDAGRLGEILDTATRNGATLGSAVVLRARAEGTVRREVLEAAGKDAREKAEALAAGVGKRLGEVSAISEEFSDGALHWTPFPLPVSSNGGAHGPGELVFHARVNVTYRLQAQKGGG